MAEPEALEALRTALESYLKAAFGDCETDQDDDFVVKRGSARVYIRPLEQEGRTFVVIWAVTNVGMTVNGELTRFLATENARLVFGKFSLNEEVPSVQFIHALLGDFLNRDELEVAVGAVAETADAYDDRIKARFGGRLFTEAPEALTQILAAAEAADQEAADEPADEGSPVVQAVFGLLSLLAAIGGAIFAYGVEGSIWLSVFVAVLALNLVGRAVPDLITDPDKLRRALYFLLFPALATGLLVATYALWERWWLSTLLGLLGGVILDGILAPRLFPRVHREELLDSMRRWARMRRSTEEH